MTDLTRQIVNEIVCAVKGLDAARQREFLCWLGEHTGKGFDDGKDFEMDGLEGMLETWLDPMGLVLLLCEYHLVMGEIELLHTKQGVVNA